MSVTITGYEIRKIILEQSRRVNVGHIGSALSIADIIAALYNGILNINHPNDPQRDRFLLSKGHAVLAVYAALFLRGWISEGELNTFCGDNTLLGVHPEFELTGIDFSTGSLGQGLSIAAGAALAARIQGASRRVFALISDAECNEGSTWEAAMFAAQHRLTNLVAILDFNKQQAFGYIKDVIDTSNMADRWRAFGWDVHEIDGHNTDEITRTIESLAADAPHMIIAHTTFGKGVSYMENRIKWHYMPMSDEEYQQALHDIQIPETH
ncbi:MAG TPA: transketolase [Aggregatilineales bacterium]|nr:transketolase [Aggregatilineales bacterium]